MRIYNQQAYLLHSRPFRDSSLLLDFLTRDYGRISLIGRGVRQAKSKNKGLLQLFTPLSISYAGKSELKTLTQVELAGSVALLKADRLFSAMYINELVVRLVHGEEVDHYFFDHYASILEKVMVEAQLEAVLRVFELQLLDALGYGLIFDIDANTGEAVSEEKKYLIQPEIGVTEAESELQNAELYSGKLLLTLAKQGVLSTELLPEAKSLMRMLIRHHLDGIPLKSRLLFSTGK